MYKGNLIRLYPNDNQLKQIINNIGACRWLYNQMLAMQRERRNNNQSASYINKFAMNNLLSTLKLEYPWLKEADSTSLQNANDSLNSAFNHFFNGKSKYPKFKSKKHGGSFKVSNINSNIAIKDNHHIKVPKLGVLYYRGKKPTGKIKSITIELKSSGKVLASVLVECDKPKELPKTNKTIGLDLGLHNLAVLSDGNSFPIYRYDKKLENQLAFWQRKYSKRLLKAKEVMKLDNTKKLTDFKNVEKARLMIAKLKEKESNQRLDNLHKLSLWLVRNYDSIAIEELKVKRMLKNHKLAKAISNASWNKLISLIEYKCCLYGKTLKKVNPKYTSQTCSKCGALNNRLNLTKYEWLKIRDWNCPNCGTHLDRDVNAALNILIASSNA